MKKKFLQTAFLNVGAPTEECLQQSFMELHRMVHLEEARIGHVFSFETKDIIKAEGAGLEMLGYKPKEWQLYTFIDSIVPIYDLLYVLYRISTLKMINQKSLAPLGNKCFFSISVPMWDRSRKHMYRAHIRAWILEYQKTDNKPLLALVVIDLHESWSKENEPPIRTIGELSSKYFSMEDNNVAIRNEVSIMIVPVLQSLGLQPMIIRAIVLLNQDMTPKKIAEELKTSIHNVNAYKRSIIRIGNSTFGQLSDAKQWARFLGQLINFEL
ncbi:MAG: hypothetical protein KDC61_19910 [Saprospiraceae bacterium]|nr:hypothetical protein [Saprospiraceae bacterium]